MIRTFRFLAALICLTVTTALLARAQDAAANAKLSVPHLIRLNGVLIDANGKPATGTIGITFSLYKEEQGGAALWIETQNVPLDAQGHYSVMLGASKPDGVPAELFASNEARWLSMEPQGLPAPARVLLLSVPYALKAGDAETIGGLPPSAFVLAAPAAAGSRSATTASTNAPPPASTVTTAGGTANTIPLFSTATDIENSAITQTGSGSTAKIGIGTTTPSSTLDVKGGANIRGTLSLNATGTATATAGKNSQPENIVSSSFSSTTNTPVNQTFQLKAEPSGNNTSSPSGTLNLLFGQGTSAPTETGLKISNNGQITFAAGQTFPGTGNGTITGVTAGTDLTGGGSNGNVTLNVDTTKVPQLNVANSFTGNQTVNGNLTATKLISTATQGTAPLQVSSTTQVPNLNASLVGGLSASAFQPVGSYATLGANSFVGDQSVTGNISSNGQVSGSTVNAAISYNIGGNPFAFGSLNTANEFFGFAGNQTMTGGDNVATGQAAFVTNITGTLNTADGIASLKLNTTGSNNSALGYSALFANSGGSSNTAVGMNALLSNTTGSSNTALGVNAGPDSGHAALTNSTAIGANAQVTASNAMVLGSISGVNGATADTLVGIGTTAPAAKLDVRGTANFGGLVTFAAGQTFPGTGTITAVNPGVDLTGGGSAGSVTLNVDTTKVLTAVLAGNGLTGGGTGGTQTLNIDTTRIPQLVANNAFAGNQTVAGNLTVTGFVTGNAGFQIGGNLFDWGSYANLNAFSGFAGNSVVTANGNTGMGVQALASNTTGNDNVAVGAQALPNDIGGATNSATGAFSLYFNSTGNSNTANGYFALYNNQTGSSNTAVGSNAGLSVGEFDTGTGNTFLGYGSAFLNPGQSNSTAIGANSQVDADNAMVLGSIYGVNGATINTNVGIGTTTPTYSLHIGNRGNLQGLGYLRVDGPKNIGSGAPAISIGGNGDFQIDASGINSGRFVVKENGFVGIQAPSPIGPLTVGQNKGPAFADAWLTYSSRRWKSNIQTLPDALSKVQQLRGVSYDLKGTGKHEIGVIAEEVGKVLPEVVTYETNGKDAQGVDYSRLTALLIEAVKQQQKQIRQQRVHIQQQQKQLGIQQKRVYAQQSQIDQLRSRNAAFEARLARVENPQRDLMIASVSVPQPKH
jgi:Chaperone of endosialidase